MLAITRIQRRFRPLTGIMVLIITLKDLLTYKDMLFPSPYGDYGSYPMTNTFAIDVMSKEFPSPYGDYGSYPHPL